MGIGSRVGGIWVGVSVGVDVTLSVGTDVLVGCAVSVAAMATWTVVSTSRVGVLPQAVNGKLIKIMKRKSLFIIPSFHSS